MDVTPMEVYVENGFRVRGKVTQNAKGFVQHDGTIEMFAVAADTEEELKQTVGRAAAVLGEMWAKQRDAINKVS